MRTGIPFILLCFLVLTSCKQKQYASKTSAKDPSTAIVKPSARDTTIKGDEHGSTKKLALAVVNPKEYYQNAYTELRDMLDGKNAINFKRAVFITENAYFGNEADYAAFCKYIDTYTTICREWMRVNALQKYHLDDSTNVAINGAIFHVMADTVFNKNHEVLIFPLVYDFDHYFPSENWTNSFVTKLMLTHKGNCHSLPFFYKILSLEMDSRCYFSISPDHLFLRMKSKKDGWYNTELTCAMFPTDAWVMASGYVSKESIVSGIYMDTIGLKQSIVLCLNDLAKGYAHKFSTTIDPDFILNCCDLGLKYYPNYAEMILLKAETLKRKYRTYIDSYGLNAPYTEPYKAPIAAIQSEMDRSYALLAKLDYREVPKEMFNEWLKGLGNNKEKYQDRRIIDTFNYKSESK
jgi:hypothetical protein